MRNKDTMYAMVKAKTNTPQKRIIVPLLWAKHSISIQRRTILIYIVSSGPNYRNKYPLVSKVTRAATSQ